MFTAMESDFDEMTPASTPASSVPSTPISPNTHLLEMLQHVSTYTIQVRLEIERLP